MVRAAIPHIPKCRQVGDRWEDAPGTITRGERRKAGLEVKNLEGPLAAAAVAPADPQELPASRVLHEVLRPAVFPELCLSSTAISSRPPIKSHHHS